MNFNEMLEAYKKGVATPEQKRMVEEEIEKNKLINDYICGDMEMEPPETKTETAGKPDKDSYKAVKKIMRRTLWKGGAIAAAVVLIALLAAQYIVSPLVASRYYNPAKVILDEESSGLYYPITRGGLDMMVSSELHNYDKILTGFYAEDLGYGKYHVQRRMYDLFDQEYNDIYMTVTKDDDDRRLWIDSRISNFIYKNEYNLSSRTYFNGPEDLSELPDTAVVEAGVLFSEEKAMPELVDLMKTNPDLFFEWVAVPNMYGPVKPGSDIPYLGILGFRPVHIPGSYSVPCDSNTGYTYLSLPDYIDITPKILEVHFTSLLTYYCDHKDYYKYAYSDNLYLDMMKLHEDTLKTIQENGVKTYGAVLIGSPKDIASLYDRGIVNGIEIYDMKYSVYESGSF